MSKLILLGTPIGNLDDISFRQLHTIFEAGIILAEDTRVFHKLKGLLNERYSSVLTSLSIVKNENQKAFSYRDQNHDRVIPQIIQQLEAGNDVVLTTDAGMPGISDPGYLLIHDVIKAGFEVETVPGPTSVVSALLLSGLPTDRFSFVGFLPRKKGKIISLIKPLLDCDTTVIFFESPFRIKKILEIFAEEFKDSEISLSNDITKKFETTIRGGVEEVLKKLGEKKVQGEWVVCVRAIT